MARIARIVVPGCPFHLTHRGNHREQIFFNDDDRRCYLGLLARYARRFEMDLWAYCLMSNHVHLIVLGQKPDSLAKAVGNAHREYSRLINRRNSWTGHLWANRFYSTALDELHLWYAVRYVEANPLRAGLVPHAVDYRWSSARAHAGLGSNHRLAPDRPFPGSIADWATWLDVGQDQPAYDELRKSTSTGRPTGSPEFKRRIEKQIGRSFQPKRLSGNRKIET